jgi:prepilin-type N-terminal cleavage/methylation domain-containing protein
MKKNIKYNRGFGMIEIVVVSAILVLVVVAVTGAMRLYVILVQSNAEKAQAALLTEEALEVVNIWRDTTWDGLIYPLSVGTPYYIYWNGTRYATSTATTTSHGSLVTKIVFGAINRNSSDNISQTGTLDPRTRQVTVTIVENATGSTPLLESAFLIHDTHEN